MGNKLCKKKGGESTADDKPHAFDRIINRLHLKPTTWKSDPQLNEKQTNRAEVKTRKSKNGIVQHSRPLSNAKSSDWTEASLEVPDKDEVVHLKNPQLSLIFNDDSTPTPPPRKHKRTLREKLETAAKNGLQALQTKKTVSVSNEVPKEESPKPVEEPPFIKKTVIYGCPLDDHDHVHHNRDHKHSQKKDIDKVGSLRFSKDAKRKKNLSVVSLPNINEFRFSLKKDDSENNVGENPEQKPKKTASTGKLESYMHRCRSIGSIFPQKTKHHKNQKTSNDADSDDSFGGLEDWDCKILEHYKPKDASLQRPRRPLSEDTGLSDVEKLIVSHEEYEKENPPPARPLRRSESLVKKEEDATAVSEEPVVIRKKENDDVQQPLLAKKTEEIETIIEKIVTTPKEENVKRTLLQRRSDENKATSTVVKKLTFKEPVERKTDDGSTTKTPPSTPVVHDNKRESLISISKLTTKDDEGNIEHSSLIKLLHEYSKKEAEEKKLTETEKEKYVATEEKMQQKEQKEDASQNLEKNPPVNSDNKISNAVEDFLNAERKSNNTTANSKSALDIFAESKCQVVS